MKFVKRIREEEIPYFYRLQDNGKCGQLELWDHSISYFDQLTITKSALFDQLFEVNDIRLDLGSYLV